ncbi:MAG: PhzF family phenazine biosynthesis protein [Pseudomonadota bacterium]
MKLTQFQVDAFADRPFTGNPAAVCPLESWLDDELLQAIAEENNLSETAFFVPTENGYKLRWFTPRSEVDLCGHATLASAHVLFEELNYSGSVINFETRSGSLKVEKRGAQLQMDFPARPPSPCEAPDLLVEGLGVTPAQMLAADDYVVVLADEDAVRSVVPNFSLLSDISLRGAIITATGSGDIDFVSRFFAPALGVPEDPVTGSAHCELAPYWAGRLGKDTMTARQLSRRGGQLTCEMCGDRVLLTGRAVSVIHATLTLHR